jgi:hypothetical protein
MEVSSPERNSRRAGLGDLGFDGLLGVHSESGWEEGWLKPLKSGWGGLLLDSADDAKAG